MRRSRPEPGGDGITPDYYRLLGVDPTADLEAIHLAYRNLARRFHPDVQGDDSTMKVINVAWDVLRNAERRALYDGERMPVAKPIPAPGPTVVAAGVGRPPGHPSGPVLTYGRYEGWSVGEIARVDPEYLEWLRRAPGYRWLRQDIDAVLRPLEADVPEPQRRKPGPFGFLRRR